MLTHCARQYPARAKKTAYIARDITNPVCALEASQDVVVYRPALTRCARQYPASAKMTAYIAPEVISPVYVLEVSQDVAVYRLQAVQI